MISKKRATPTDLTEYEYSVLDQCLKMNEYWFDVFFASKSRFVESPAVYYEEIDGESKFHTAKIFSVDAQRVKDGCEEEKENCTYCFFVFFEDRVWKKPNMREVGFLLELLKKSQKWDKYHLKVLKQELKIGSKKKVTAR